MLDLVGWRALQCVRHYAESMQLMQAAWREVGVSLYALLHMSKIGHTVRITCVHVGKFREATRIRFYRGLHTKNRKIGRTVR